MEVVVVGEGGCVLKVFMVSCFSCANMYKHADTVTDSQLGSPLSNGSVAKIMPLRKTILN